MAKVTFALQGLENLLFQYSENSVSILRVHSFDEHHLTLEIDGFDVPAVNEVRALTNVKTNSAGEQFHTMWFEEVR